MNALVTGAARGLGLALCRRFAGEGHRVFAGVRSLGHCPQLDALAARYSGVTPLQMDVTDEAQVQATARQVESDCGALDCVLSNAAVLCDSDRGTPITQADLPDFELALRVNVVGAAAVIKHFQALVRDGGAFLTITSEGGALSRGGTVYPAYAVTKAAANKLVFLFAQSQPRLRVYAVHPGRLNTVMGREFAQIEPEESAEGLYRICTLAQPVPPGNGWFINHKGEAMPL